MKIKLILIIGILLLGSRVFAQPMETTYVGNVAVDGYVDDESYGPINIGFNFTFFGNSYSQFYINSNGQVLFGEGSLESVATGIPNAALPNNYIAPFWDDLVVDAYGKILYTTIGAAPNRKLIVQFKNIGFYPYPATLGTFSVILYETSNLIQVQYRLIVLSYSPKGHGSTATIGLENSDGSIGVQYAFQNPDAVHTSQAISFKPVAGPSYTVNSNAVYDGVFLTTNLSLPEPRITNLISPPQDAVIGSSFKFEWASALNAASYTLFVGTDPELVEADAYSAGSNLSYSVSGLVLDQTYYWGVFSQNATGTTWCEIKKFTTSSAPPLAPVPQTLWTEQYTDKTIKLNYTGGDASIKTAIITTLPAPGHGQLYQYNAGARGSLISTIPTTLTDVNRNVIYSASGGTGNGEGNFNFRIHETSGDSPEGLITINVSPPGVPNVLYFARSTTYIEIQFDIPISVPSGNEGQFIVTADGSVVNVSSVNVKTGDPYTIQLNLASPIQPTDNILVSYSPGFIAGFTGGLLLPFTDEPVTLLAQTINFSQSLDRVLADSPFALSASASSVLGMTYSSSNLSVATISGNVATFHAVGISDITALQSGNAAYAPAKYVKLLTVAEGLPVFKTLNLTSVFLQGLYAGGGTMNQAYDETGNPHWPAGVADHITVELHDASTYNTVIYTIADVPLSITGNASVTIPASYSSSYYISIKNRNHLKTTTASPVLFSDGIISYAFNHPSKVYGGNLELMSGSGTYYAIYGGDSNGDGVSDGLDLIEVENGVILFSMGYLVIDLNSDGIVDAFDLILAENNAYKFVGEILP